MLQINFMHAQKPPVWLVKNRYMIGSDRNCDIMLSDPAVAAKHAELLVEQNRVQLVPMSSGASVSVDDEPIYTSVEIGCGRKIRLGGTEFAIADSSERGISSDSVLNGWYLQGKTTALSNRQYPIKGEIMLGRSKECDICLAVAHLSRRHARIRVTETYLEVEDLGSLNGTFLNRQRIDRARAHLGDELRFDTLTFRVCHKYENAVREESTTVRACAPAAKRTAVVAQARDEAPAQSAASEPRAESKAERPVPRARTAAAAESGESGSLMLLLLGCVAVATATGGLLYYFVT